jgi:hypothetical protein
LGGAMSSPLFEPLKSILTKKNAPIAIAEIKRLIKMPDTIGRRVMNEVLFDWSDIFVLLSVEFLDIIDFFSFPPFSVSVLTPLFA